MQRKKQGRKKFLTAKLSTLIETERDDSNLAEMIDTKIQLNFEIEKDKAYWEQRARLNWLKLGDRNTTFFHSQATQRKKMNVIIRLQNKNGQETNDSQEMKHIAQSYFEELFSSENQTNYERILSGIDRCNSDDDNRKLNAKYTKEEGRLYLKCTPRRNLGKTIFLLFFIKNVGIL